MAQLTLLKSCRAGQSTYLHCSWAGFLSSFGHRHYYTPGIYAEGYIVFVFPFVRPYVHLYVCSYVCSYFLSSRKWNLEQSFMLKFLMWGISHQPLIIKHSYLDNRYPGESAFIPWLLTVGSMPQGGARGQNLGHLLEVFFYFSVIKTTYENSWSNLAQPCNIDLRVMTYISWSSDLVLYLEDYLMYEHHSAGLWVSTTRRLTSKQI